MTESKELAELKLMIEFNKNLGQLKDVVAAQEKRISVLGARVNQLELWMLAQTEGIK